jgi:cysteinyl-tRNA synthetase
LADDFNSPILIAALFEAVSLVNNLVAGNEKITSTDLQELKTLFNDFVVEILGLLPEGKSGSDGNNLSSQLIDLLLNMRMEAKRNKDWATSDNIRNKLTAMGVEIKDTKDGFEWEMR